MPVLDTDENNYKVLLDAEDIEFLNHLKIQNLFIEVTGGQKIGPRNIICRYKGETRYVYTLLFSMYEDIIDKFEINFKCNSYKEKEGIKYIDLRSLNLTTSVFRNLIVV